MQLPASIGIVLHDFPLGGTERIALRLAKAWCDRGVRITVFVGEDGGPLRSLVPSAARLMFADPPIRRGRGSRKRLGRAAARYFSANRVDGLFIPGNYHWNIVPALAAMADRPAIVVQVSSPLRMVPRGPLRRLIFDRRMRSLLRQADALVTMTETHRCQADAIMRRPSATTIPLPALEDDDRALVHASGRTILAAGRLIRQKGFDLLIAAFRLLDDGNARLVIVGSGPEAATLARQAEASGVGDRITFAGYQPDIRPFLDAARLLVMPSRFEGYGAVIVEALGAGRPVIATTVTPAADLLLGEAERGMLVPAGDVGALTAALRSILDAPAPDPLKLASAVSDHRIEIGAESYLACFARVLADRHNG